MSGCTICGERERLGYICKLCGQDHCPDHRLPENHDCAGLVAYDRTQPWFFTDEATVKGGTERARDFRRKAPEALERGTLGHLPGTAPEPDYGSSPDVATDGSMISSNRSAGPRSNSIDFGRRLWWNVTTRFERYRDRPTALLIDLLWIALICSFAAIAYAFLLRLS